MIHCQVRAFNTNVQTDEDTKKLEEKVNAFLKEVPFENIIEFIPLEKDAVILVRYRAEV